jgi:hypothetical protein
MMRSAFAAAVAVVLVGVLAGCVQNVPAASTPLPVPVPTPSGTSTASALPTYNPSGTATDNLAYFNMVGNELFASTQASAASSQGEAIVNWFVSHGFDKKNMEVTPDKTAIGLAAWNIDFSVRFGKTCILGQAGNVGFQSATIPVLATGKCLVGVTRPIDW